MDKKGEETKGGLDDIADKGVAIGAAVIAGTGAAIGGLMAMANGTSETAAKWLELSQRTDIGVESLQKWGYAAEMSGADIGKLEVGMKKLSDTMVDAQNGGKASQAAYEKLGISMQQLSTMTPEQAFEKVMYSLADMKEGALKNSIGNDILGKSFTELKPLLAEGSSGMEALKQKAVEMGIVMSEDSVVAAESMGDELDNVKKDFEGVKNKIVLELIPKLTELFQWIQSNMPLIQEISGKALNFVANAVMFVANNVNWLIPVLGILLGSFVALKVISVLSGMMETYATVITKITALSKLLTIEKLKDVAATIYLNALYAKDAIVKWASVAAQTAYNIAVGAWNVIGVIAAGVTTAFGAAVAFLTSPIGLVVLAITGLIAAGVLLYKNWDVIKAKMSEVWGSIKNGVSSSISSIIEFFSNLWNKASTIASNIKSAFSNLFGGLKVPHIKIKSGSLNPLKWFDDGFPKLSVDWYAKGGIFDKPTIFNTPYGLKGVGDNKKSPEVVAPLHKLSEMLGLDKREQRTVNVNFYPKNMTKADMEMAFNYVNRRFGLEL